MFTLRCLPLGRLHFGNRWCFHFRIIGRLSFGKSWCFHLQHLGLLARLSVIFGALKLAGGVIFGPAVDLPFFCSDLKPVCTNSAEVSPSPFPTSSAPVASFNQSRHLVWRFFFFFLQFLLAE